MYSSTLGKECTGKPQKDFCPYPNSLLLFCSLFHIFQLFQAALNSDLKLLSSAPSTARACGNISIGPSQIPRVNTKLILNIFLLSRISGLCCVLTSVKNRCFVHFAHIYSYLQQYGTFSTSCSNMDKIRNQVEYFLKLIKPTYFLSFYFNHFD